MGSISQRLIRRFGSSLPDPVKDAARTFRAIRSGAPVVGTPSYTAVLFVGAHPDDESAMAGGTIAALTDAGTRVDLVTATAGEATKGVAMHPDEVGRRRAGELAAACDILGVSHHEILGLPDGKLGEHVFDIRDAVTDRLTAGGYQAVFTPWWADGHADHEAVAWAVASIQGQDYVDVWAGEIWTPLVPNRLVDMTAYVEVKHRALAAHATAGAAFEFDGFIGLNRYRSIHGLRGNGYAEAFVGQPLAAFADLVRTAGNPGYKRP